LIVALIIHFGDRLVAFLLKTGLKGRDLVVIAACFVHQSGIRRREQTAVMGGRCQLHLAAAELKHCEIQTALHKMVLSCGFSI